MLKETVTTASGGHPCVLIETECGALLGPNRASLLENIVSYPSLSEAARATGITLEHALELVETMNASAKYSLTVEINGQYGLTPAGEITVRSFRALYEEFKQDLYAEFQPGTVTACQLK